MARNCAVKIVISFLLVGICASTMAADDLYPVRVSKKWGYIDSTGRVIIEPQFDAARQFSEGRAGVFLKKRWTYIDHAGRFIAEPSWSICAEFHEGLALVCVATSKRELATYGYIDTNGKYAIAPIWHGGSRFENGVAVVREGIESVEVKNNYQYLAPVIGILGASLLSASVKSGRFITKDRYLFIRRNGTRVSTNDLTKKGMWRKVGGLKDGLVMRWSFYNELEPSDDEKDVMTYVNPDGSEEFRLNCDRARAFGNGRAPVKVGKRWGYVNRKGRMIISLSFQEAHPYSEGFAAVRIDDEWRFIDTNGAMVMSTGFGNVRLFESEQYLGSPIRVDELSLSGYSPTPLNFFGNPLADDEWGFSGGLAAVEYEGKWGFVDRVGKYAVLPDWEGVQSFRGELAAVMAKRKIGYVNRTGKLIWEPSD